MAETSGSSSGSSSGGDSGGGGNFAGWIGTIVQGVTGGIQMGVAMDSLSRLPGYKQYSTGADLETATLMARRAAQQGMSPAERAVAEQQIGTAQSRTQRAMEQRGLGNLAAAVSQIRTTEAMNQLAAQNAQIKRQSLGQYSQLAGQIQAIESQNIQSFNQMLMSQQTALGQAAQAGFKNLAGTGASIAEATEGQGVMDKQTYSDDQILQIEQMKQNRPMERTPDSTIMKMSDSDLQDQMQNQFFTGEAAARTSPEYQAGLMPQMDFNANNYFGDMGYTEPTFVGGGQNAPFFDTTSTGAMAPGGVDAGTYTHVFEE